MNRIATNLDTGKTQYGWTIAGRGRIFDASHGRFPVQSAIAQEVELSILAKYLGPGRILDLGAGTGRTAIPFSRLALADPLVTLDPSHAMLQQFLSAPEIKSGKILPIVGVSLNELPFDDDTFDHVYSMGVVSHFQDWISVLRPVTRILKLGGHFIFTHRCLDSALMWAAQNERTSQRGMFRLDEIGAALDNIGLRVRHVIPTDIFNIRAIDRAWLDGNFQERSPLVRYSMQAWLNDLHENIPDMSPWLRVETALLEILPPTAALGSFVVAARAGANEAPSDIGNYAPGRDVYGEVEEYLSKPDMVSLLEDERYLSLLVTASPVIASFCGGRNPVVDAIPGADKRLETLQRALKSATVPNLRTYSSKFKYDAHRQLTSLYVRIGNRIQRRLTNT